MGCFVFQDVGFRGARTENKNPKIIDRVVANAHPALAEKSPSKLHATVAGGIGYVLRHCVNFSVPVSSRSTTET